MFDAQVLLQIGWTSVATSTYYVLFAVAFALTLKVAQVWNFVQAGTMGFAFYAMYAAMLRWDWPHWAGFLFGLAVAVAVAVASEVWGYRVLRRRRSHGLLMFIFAIVVAEFVAYLLSLVFGTEPQSLQKSLVSDVYMVGGVVVTSWDLKALAITATVCAALWAFLRYSREGQFMHAVSDNGQLAELYGISANRAYVVSMAISALLITVGTYLYGTRASMIPTGPLEIILLAVIATILGGIGSLVGAGISAVFLSLLQSSSILVIPSQWQSSLTYFVLFAVILFFPTGFRVPGWLRRRKA
ncbi:MAG: branched-chain amino acid ABC transporter permease [Candidatus Parcubacteria bacterium]|nr:branched-chain amino acid ABC transporter permease [Burkholderiales bacterium]